MADAVVKTRKKRKMNRRFYVPASRFSYPPSGPPTVTLDRDSTHHVRNVLRLSVGAHIVVFDNSGQEYEGEITDCKPTQIKVKVERSTKPMTEPTISITVAQSIIKGNGFDHTLTLCTELGCARFIPLFTSRTVARINKSDFSARVKRWERIVAEASAQSGRVKVPRVEPPTEFKGFLEKKVDGAKIILWERGGAGQLGQILGDEKCKAATLLVGPEGGFSQAEVKAAMDAGYQVWGLGPRILRAETCASIAIGILEYAVGDMG